MSIDAVQQLVALLREAKAVPRLRANAVGPSSIYDPLYRTVIIGLALRLCGKKATESEVTLAGPRLKLFQFVAVHRHLLPSLRGWVTAHETGRRPNLEEWTSFPRGYVADSLYERIVTYLVATGELRPEGKNLVGSLDARCLLGRLVVAVDANSAFEGERSTLIELSQTRITLGMLGA